MNRISRTLAALIVATGLTATVMAPADAAPAISFNNHQWCC
jgi:hypothetical protein